VDAESECFEESGLADPAEPTDPEDPWEPVEDTDLDLAFFEEVSLLDCFARGFA
jgi:hypothetical protein